MHRQDSTLMISAHEVGHYTPWGTKGCNSGSKTGSEW